MNRFTYTRGIWSDGIDLPDWAENEDFTDYLMRIGFSPAKSSVGSEHGSSFDIYESSTKDVFYASVSPTGGACFDVFLPDFPSLMMFLRDFGQAFATISIRDDQEQTLSLLEKLFRAYHKHSHWEACEQCDPAAWESNRKRARERANRENAG